MNSFKQGPNAPSAGTRRARYLTVGACATGILLPAAPATAMIPKANVSYAVYEVRSMPTSDMGIARPTSLAFSPRAGALLVGQPSRGTTALLTLGLAEEARGTVALPALPNPSTLTFDGVKDRLVTVRGDGLVAVRPGSRSRRPAGNRIARLKLGDPQGITSDRRRRAWFVLDNRSKAIVRLPMSGGRRARPTRISLARFGDLRLRGIAFDPSERLLYVLAEDQLIALDTSGRLERTVNLKSLRLADPRAIVFAPSGDPTDAPSNHHLYIADRGSRTRAGRVVEAAFESLTDRSLLADVIQPTLVQTIATSAFSPPSPDPAGITYIPATDRLLIADSEVDEMTLYQGRNLFTTTRTGAGLGTGTTLAFSKEPTGIGYDPTDRTLYVTDDDADRVSVVRPGADGVHGTADDSVTRFLTSAFGSTDAEGIEYDVATGRLFICDGAGLEVYVVDPVNGTFGDGNDSVTSFDLSRHGLRDCEGLGLDAQRRTLLAVDPSRRWIYELTMTGDLVRTLDASAVPQTNRNYASVTMAPSSDPTDAPTAMNYWVVDRQVDNSWDPNENDGLLYELAVPSTQPPPDGPPTVAISDPAESALVTGTVLIRASAQDDVAVTQVSFSVDGTVVGTDTTPEDGWSASWDTSALADGAHTVTATATDGAGNSASDSNAVIVDNSAPSVALTGPAEGATLKDTVSVTATASDNHGVASVEINVDGVRIGVDANGADGWSVSWDTTTSANGPHSVTAVAVDRAGHRTTSPASNVTVDNPPVLTRPVGAGADDADEIPDGTVRRTPGDLELGSDHGSATTVGLRFTGVTVPSGATIDRAYVQFQPDEKGRTATTLTIRAVLSGNAAPIASTPFDISSRPRSAAAVSWTPPSWFVGTTANNDHRTPDLSAPLGEVFAQPSWAPGNALMLVVTGSGRRTAESFEGGAPPVLHLQYTAP